MIVLIDDRRAFVDERDAIVLRTPKEGFDWLLAHKNVRIDELWLDHDMGWEGTIKPVWEELERASGHEEPYDIGVIRVVTANPGMQMMMVRSLTARGYNAIPFDSDWHCETVDKDILKRTKERHRA